jgi:hypothetical protein
MGHPSQSGVPGVAAHQEYDAVDSEAAALLKPTECLNGPPAPSCTRSVSVLIFFPKLQTNEARRWLRSLRRRHLPLR